MTHRTRAYLSTWSCTFPGLSGATGNPSASGRFYRGDLLDLRKGFNSVIPLASLIPEGPNNPDVAEKPVPLGFPRDLQFRFRMTLPGMTAPDFQPSRISKDFAEFETSGAMDKDAVQLDWHLRWLKSEANPTEYAAFRKEIISHILPVDPEATTAAAPPNSLPSNPVELRRLGTDAFSITKISRTRRDISEAAVAANSTICCCLERLGPNLSSTRLLDKASSAFSKAIDINPNEQVAYNNLGLCTGGRDAG